MQLHRSTLDNSVTIETEIQSAPAARLNAEMFVADDIDGVTEGLTGSGNLNYLILQSQQTNDMQSAHDPFNGTETDYGAEGLSGLNGGFGSGDLRQFQGYSPSDFSDDNSIGAGLLNINNIGGNPGSGIDGNNGAGGSTTLSSFSYGGFNAGFNQATSSTTGLFGSDGTDGDSGLSGEDGSGNNGLPGQPGTNGNNGRNGRDGKDGNGGGDDNGDDDVDLNLDVISDIVNLNLEAVLDPIENIIGDIDVDIDAILGNILSPDDGILPNPSVILDVVLGGTEILNDFPINVILTPVEDAASGLIDAVNPVLGEILPFTPDPLGTVADVLGMFNNDGDSDLVVNLGMSLPDAFGLSALGGGSIDIPLDPVESVSGDIDIAASVDVVIENLITTDLSDLNIDISLITDGDMIPSLDTLISSNDISGSVADVAGDISDILGEGSEPNGEDTDLSVDTGFDVLDHTVDNLDVGATLDPAENIIGDIDIDVDMNTDIVNDILSGDVHAVTEDIAGIIEDLVDINLDLFSPEPDQNDGIGLEVSGTEVLGGFLSGDGEGISWPEETISDVLGYTPGGDSDLLGGIALPEPEGIVCDGIALIDNVSSSGDSGGVLGGLGGVFG